MFWESKNKVVYVKKRNKKKKGKKRKEKKISMLVLLFNVFSVVWEEVIYLYVVMLCNVLCRGGVERIYCIKLENIYEFILIIRGVFIDLLMFLLVWMFFIWRVLYLYIVCSYMKWDVYCMFL